MFARASRVCTRKVGQGQHVGPIGMLTIGAGAGTCYLYSKKALSCEEMKQGFLQQMKLSNPSAIFGFIAPTAVQCEEVRCEDAKDKEKTAADPDEPVFSLAEVAKHQGGDSIWVTYKGGVYDVTEYLHLHPGGQDIILAAGGQDVEAAWDNYGIHKKNGKALPMLEAMRIGSLSEEDRALAKEQGYDFAKRFKKMDSLQRHRLPKLALVTISLPICWAVRYALRILGHLQITQPFITVLSWLLPISVPGYGRAAPVPAKQSDGRKTRVAVVGAGISGCGAVYALTESGYEVTVYEGRATLGGNAQTFDFGGTRLDGLVSYWHSWYYPNYCSLLRKLGCTVQNVYIPHVLHSTLRGKDEYYTFREGPIHGNGRPEGSEFVRPEPSNNEEFAHDLVKYGRAVNFTRFLAQCCSWESKATFYNLYNGFLPYINPANFIGVKTWCCSIFGCSTAFWDNVLLPYHAFNHFGVDCEHAPAVCLPVVEDICPMLPDADTYLSYTWDRGTSAEVFRKLTAKAEVKLNTRVAKVHDLGKGKLEVVDDEGSSQTFDRVIFACPASAVANAIESQSSWLERTLLRSVKYRDDTDHLWVRGWAHQDGKAPFPEKVADNMNKNCAFWLSVTPGADFVPNTSTRTSHDRNAVHFELTQNARIISGQCYDNPPDALVTFNLKESDPSKGAQYGNIDPSKVVQEVCISRSHPNFEFQNLFLTFLLPLVQGRRGIYYCSNYTCNNSHDLALLSGFSCAQAIGAKHPIMDNPDKAECKRAASDFANLSGMMGLDEQSFVKDMSLFGVRAACLWLFTTAGGLSGKLGCI